MIAFQVSINGEVAGTFGFEDWTVLLAHLRAFRRKPGNEVKSDELQFGITGIAGSRSTGHENVDMFERSLCVGDLLVLKIVETCQVDPPVRRSPIDATWTDEEWLEAEREEYERLKAKFEPGP
jgi:hypothetical protein